jgi:phage shock protein PspC (stress-responsive transcriptional regulator)
MLQISGKMDKTIKINLAGVLFQLEEDAYKMLREYLHAIGLRLKSTPEGNETLEDIESRIAEIFQSQKSIAGVITKENVNAMMAIIGQPEDFENFPSEEEQSSPTQKRTGLFRNTNDAILGGVCSGTGSYLKIDPVWIRILFVITSFFFGLGIFLYIALWIALPKAGLTDRKYFGSSPAGNVINEIFRASGKAFFVILRVVMIILGITLIITGFLTLICFVVLFFFKYPAPVSTEVVEFNLFYLKDFINLIVNTSVTPWIIGLAFIVVALPMLALIYWGVKSILWFKARDGVISLAGFLLWIGSLAVLAMILLNQGVSFTQRGQSSQNLAIPAPDTLHVLTGRKISDLQSTNRLCLPDKKYSIIYNEGGKDINIGTQLGITKSEDEKANLRIKKRSSGHSTSDAMEKARKLEYNFSFSRDTLLLDEYFVIPSGRKWSFDEISITLSVPEGTVIHVNDPSGPLFYHYHNNGIDEEYIDSRTKTGIYLTMNNGHLEKIMSDPEK